MEITMKETDLYTAYEIRKRRKQERIEKKKEELLKGLGY